MSASPPASPPPSVPVKPAYNSVEYAKTTSVALAMIGLFLLGAGFVLMGLQTLPATMHIGYGVALFFIGAQIAAVGGGQAIAAVGFAAYAIYYSMRPSSNPEHP